MYGRQKQNWLRLCVLVTLLLSLTACGSVVNAPAPTAAVAQTKLIVSGSGGTRHVVELLSEQYDVSHDDLSFEFLSGAGSSGAIKGLQEGQFDLAAMARALDQSELAAGIDELQFGVDKVVIITSSDLEVTGLTEQQVKDILTGKITNWSAVGGPDAAINLFIRDEEDPGTAVLRRALLGDEAFASTAVVMTSGSKLQEAMTRTTGAIAYHTFSSVQLESMPVHVLTVDGTAPADAKYPYSRPLSVAYLAISCRMRCT